MHLEGEGKIKNLKLRIVKEEPEKSFIKREISYTHGSSQTRKVYQFQVCFELCMIKVILECSKIVIHDSRNGFTGKNTHES